MSRWRRTSLRAHGGLHGGTTPGVPQPRGVHLVRRRPAARGLQAVRVRPRHPAADRAAAAGLRARTDQRCRRRSRRRVGRPGRQRGSDPAAAVRRAVQQHVPAGHAQAARRPSTYFWTVTNRKTPERRGFVQLVDARELWQKMRKSLGTKRKELADAHIAEITRLYGEFADGERVRSCRTRLSDSCGSPSNDRCGCAGRSPATRCRGAGRLRRWLDCTELGGRVGGVAGQARGAVVDRRPRRVSAVVRPPVTGELYLSQHRSARSRSSARLDLLWSYSSPTSR